MTREIQSFPEWVTAKEWQNTTEDVLLCTNTNIVQHDKSFVQLLKTVAACSLLTAIATATATPFFLSVLKTHKDTFLVPWRASYFCVFVVILKKHESFLLTLNNCLVTKFDLVENELITLCAAPAKKTCLGGCFFIMELFRKLKGSFLYALFCCCWFDISLWYTHCCYAPLYEMTMNKKKRSMSMKRSV